MNRIELILKNAGMPPAKISEAATAITHLANCTGKDAVDLAYSAAHVIAANDRNARSRLAYDQARSRFQKEKKINPE